MAKKRERLEIIRDILHSIRNSRDIKPTKLLYASNLSPQMFRDYINELVLKGFIKLNIDEKEQKMFSLTPKGSSFLEEHKVIENFVANFGL